MFSDQALDTVVARISRFERNISLSGKRIPSNAGLRAWQKVTFSFSLKMFLELSDICKVLAHLTRTTFNRFIVGQIFIRAQKAATLEHSWNIAASLLLRNNTVPLLHTVLFSSPFSERWWHCELHRVATARLCSLNRTGQMMQIKPRRSWLCTYLLSASQNSELNGTRSWAYLPQKRDLWKFAPPEQNLDRSWRGEQLGTRGHQGDAELVMQGDRGKQGLRCYLSCKFFSVNAVLEEGLSDNTCHFGDSSYPLPVLLRSHILTWAVRMFHLTHCGHGGSPAASSSDLAALLPAPG